MREFLVLLEKVASKSSKRKRKIIIESSRLYGFPKASFIKIFIKSLKLLVIIKVKKIITQPVVYKQIFCYNLDILIINKNKMSFLIFPLGNPGEKYAKTRHNAGRIVYSFLNKEESFQNVLGQYDVDIFISQGFMNESGKYLKKYLKNKNIDTKNIIVLYDDKDLEIGDVRLSKDRGDGGHNGLKNIIENLGTKDFPRIRIGIAPKGTGKDNLIPPHGDIVQKYVLDKMPKEEIEILASKKVLERVVYFLIEVLK